jgi:membrane protease YdiL (CAAX protease family)
MIPTMHQLSPDAPEPGGPSTARFAAMVVITLTLAVTLLQQFGGSSAARSVGQPAGAPGTAGIAPPETQFEVTAKIATKLHVAFGSDARLGAQLLGSLGDLAKLPEDKLRLAIVARAMDGADAAVRGLDGVEGNLPPDSPLREDADAVRTLLSGGSIAPADAARLEQRHGWFGRLANVMNLPESDPRREDVVGGGAVLLALVVLVVLGGGAALIVGFVLLLAGLVRGASGRLRRHFVPRAPGGSVLIETVAVFMAGFILLKFVVGALAGVVGEGIALPIGLGAQWLLALVILWPRYRGVPLGRALHDLGLHRGGGVLREVGAGVVGYVVCLPLFFGGVVTSLVLMLLYQLMRTLWGLGPPESPHNPIVDIVTDKSGPWRLALFFVLASMWAPLVEESIFRGALFGHLRARWRVFPAAAVVAVVFGLMHGYQLLMLGPVIGLGFGFCLLREWRGSLIASMTAHCLHNAGMLVLLLTALRIAG